MDSPSFSAPRGAIAAGVELGLQSVIPAASKTFLIRPRWVIWNCPSSNSSKSIPRNSENCSSW
eukprot:scaffold27939_cov84-Amphora_coffeaeformis.AAC.1